MPTYAFHCEECDSHFTVRKSMAKRDEETFCPNCGTTHTRRLISAAAVFTVASDGQQRALAGSPSCGGCSNAGTGCAACNSH